MRIIIFCILLAFISACKKENPLQKSEQNTSISLEKKDENIEINKKNIPLPVNEDEN